MSSSSKNSPAIESGEASVYEALSFDPSSREAWAELRALGHDMLNDMFDALMALPGTPAWREMPPGTRQRFTAPLTPGGIGAAAAYERFRADILPYGNGNWHPRFFGWVQGNGTPLAMLADMLASGMNPHLAGFDQAPALVERQVVGWLAEWMGMTGASGIFVTGGTMANVHAMMVARHAGALKQDRNIREFGLQAWPGLSREAPLVFYGSSETHGWALKAAEWLGLGRHAFRQVPVADDYTLRVDLMQEMIESDRAAGMQPFCVIGTAATVNTGAIDDLETIADLAARESLWFHVDGAFGAMIALAPSLRSRLRGMERADSLAFDLHKWGSMPFECACVLIRDPLVHTQALKQQAAYLGATERGVSHGGLYFNDHGLDLTRGFKAFKLWMQLQADGVEKFGRIIEQNVRQTQLLVSLIEQYARLELLAPAPLNIVCFRYRPAAPNENGNDSETANNPGTSGAPAQNHDLDALNTEILQRLHERGIAIPSFTRIKGQFAIRVAHVNHRSTDDDIIRLAAAVVELGDELAMRQ